MNLDLARTPTDELVQLSKPIRNTCHGSTVTYSPKAFFPLTQLCRDRCGYCTFAKAPARTINPYMTPDQVRELGSLARKAGCIEALFTLGEKPELRYRRAQLELEKLNAQSTISYLAETCRLTLDELDLLPHPNAGAISFDELALLKTVSVSQGMMLETLREDLPAHKLAPDKSPARRMETLTSAGELKIPFTTGILVGIGETEEDRIRSLQAIAELHLKYGHIQEVIVQNFLPKPGTPMSKKHPPSKNDYIRAIALARILLPPEVHIQAPPNLSDDIISLIQAGVDDLGGISPVTMDYVNPERPWPQIQQLEMTLEQNGFALTPRLPVHPEFLYKEGFVDSSVLPHILKHVDSEGYARGDSFISGGSPNFTYQHRPPVNIKGTDPDLAEIFSSVEGGTAPDEHQLLTLFTTRGNRVRKVIEFADHLRTKVNGNRVTFVANRNINYTNMCTFKCRFCAFSKGPSSLNLKEKPYLLSLDQVLEKVVEAREVGATEVCLQGGIHPSFDAEYYLDLIRNIHRHVPEVHIHAFSALEVFQGAKRSGISLDHYLTMLKEAGLRTLPGTAAEILDDEVRMKLCPDKLSTDEWLEVHETAHNVGLKSNVTIMFGSIEQPSNWVKHLLRTRDLQDRTGGFTEFVPLPFVHMGSPIYLRGEARRGPTFRETLLMHAIGRIAYHGLIHNIQASWVKLGVSGVQALLSAGANDLGGTLMEESISHAAGSEHGKFITVSTLETIVRPLKRHLQQRSTLYEIVNEHPRDSQYFINYVQSKKITLSPKVESQRGIPREYADISHQGGAEPSRT